MRVVDALMFVLAVVYMQHFSADWSVDRTRQEVLLDALYACACAHC